MQSNEPLVKLTNLVNDIKQQGDKIREDLQILKEDARVMRKCLLGVKSTASTGEKEA